MHRGVCAQAFRAAVMVMSVGALSCLQSPLPPAPDTAPEAPPAPDVRGDRTLLAQWFLTTSTNVGPRIEYLADLPESLLSRGVIIEALPGCEFRLDLTAWVRTQPANCAAYLKPFGPVALSAAPDTLATYMGLADDSLAVEMLDSKLWLEALAGVPCPTFAYPHHEHDRRAMLYAEACGYLAARDGQPTLYPWGSSLLGPNGDPAWLRTWDRCSLCELPLLLLCADVQAQDPAGMAEWLADPARLPLWKQEHSWIHMYTHSDDPAQTSTPILDAEHLAALLDALLADRGVWIAPVGEVAAFVRATHQPGAEPLVWEADIPTSVGERSGPWQGRDCAFSFSTDDGFKANLTRYAPVFVARRLAYTAYLTPYKILMGDAGYPPYLTGDEVRELAALGMEIGCHGMNHVRVISDLACTARAQGDQDGDLWLEIGYTGGLAFLRVTASR